jgi:hypothetical protein
MPSFDRSISVLFYIETTPQVIMVLSKDSEKKIKLAFALVGFGERSLITDRQWFLLINSSAETHKTVRFFGGSDVDRVNNSSQIYHYGTVGIIRNGSQG